jgi:hypothetical protein
MKLASMFVTALAACTLAAPAIADGPSVPRGSPVPHPMPPARVWTPRPMTLAERAVALGNVVGVHGLPPSAPNRLRAPFEVNLTNFFSAYALSHGFSVYDPYTMAPSFVMLGKAPQQTSVIAMSVPAGGKWFVDCAINDQSPPPPATTAGPAEYGVFYTFGAQEGTQPIQPVSDHLAFTLALPDGVAFNYIHIWRSGGPPGASWIWYGCKVEPIDS